MIPFQAISVAQVVECPGYVLLVAYLLQNFQAPLVMIYRLIEIAFRPVNKA